MSTPEAEARRWLAYARSDLEAAQELLKKPDSYPRQVCFLAQQAAEQILKFTPTSHPALLPACRMASRIA